MLLPATLPYMFTGFRLSLGIAWLVIVAAEMLTGAPGVGGFLWQEYNALIYEHIICASSPSASSASSLDRLMSLVGSAHGRRVMAHSRTEERLQGFRHAESGTPEVLQDINSSIEEGEFVAIVGYSGAGKTTLISLIAGLIKPDAGTITLDDEPSPGPAATAASCSRTIRSCRG